MQRKIRRPAQYEPGAMANNTKEAGERLRLSRERLMASDLKQNTRAWRLWATCVEATVGYTREADQTYVVGLARQANMERQVASKLLEQFTELGVFDWRSGPRGSHTPGILTLPSGGHSGTVSRASGGQSGTVSTAAQGVRVTPLHSNELSTKCNAVSLDVGAQRSPLSTHRAPDSLEGSEGWEAERRAIHEARPAPEAWDVLAAELDAVLPAEHEPDLAELFPPFHGDERTGDGVGDDEASQMRWRAANPSKVRARRRRER